MKSELSVSDEGRILEELSDDENFIHASLYGSRDLMGSRCRVLLLLKKGSFLLESEGTFYQQLIDQSK